MDAARQRLGDSGVEMSRLGFGCAGFWARPMFAETKAVRLVHRALDLGVAWFDTSPHYAGGEAEARLGRALGGGRREEAVIATKAGNRLGRAGRVHKDFSPAAIRSSVLGSLGRLGVEGVDLLQLHSPQPSDLTDEVLECLVDLRVEGLVRAFGVSSSDEGVCRAVAESKTFDVVMSSYSIVDAARGPLVATLAESGKAFIAATPLARGLFKANPSLRRRTTEAILVARTRGRYRQEMKRGRELRFVEGYDGWTGSEIALAFVLANPAVTSAVFGTTDETHLEENAAVVDRTLPEDIRRRIEAVGSG